MPRFMIGTAEDLTTIEEAVWAYNLRWVSNTYWNGILTNCVAHVDVPESEVTDEQLADREAFPLFGYCNGRVNCDTGYTRRWDVPHEVDNPASPYVGSYFMRMPDEHPRVVGIWESLASELPAVTIIEAEYTDLVIIPAEE